MITRILLIGPLLMLALAGTIAQSDTDRKNGIRAGYHLATMVQDGSKPDTAKNLSSFYVGFFREQPLKGILSTNAGIEYFQNGQKFSSDYKRVIHTLSIPVNLKVNIGPAFAVGGITANFKVAERYVRNGDKIKPEKGNKANWFDSAAFAGAGVRISVFMFEARYHWGLVNMGNGLHNRYFQLGGAILF